MKYIDYWRALKTQWPTEFLERRELQLIIEAAGHPIDSPQSLRLVQLSRRLLDALSRMEGSESAPFPASLGPNHWQNCMQPDGIKML